MMQALSNTLWALSKLGFLNIPLLDAMAAVATKKLSEFNSQNIANTVGPNFASDMYNGLIFKQMELHSLPNHVCSETLHLCCAL